MNSSGGESKRDRSIQQNQQGILQGTKLLSDHLEKRGMEIAEIMEMQGLDSMPIELFDVRNDSWGVVYRDLQKSIIPLGSVSYNGQTYYIGIPKLDDDRLP